MLGRTSALARLLFSLRLPLSTLQPQATTLPFSHYSNYFEPKLTVLQQECGQLIRELGKQRPDQKQLCQLLDDYVNYDRPSSMRSLNGILAILTAISLSTKNPNSNIKSPFFNRYRYQLLEHINRVSMEGIDIDQVGMSCFINAEHDQRKIAKEKMKSTRMLFNLLVLLEHNFGAVRPQHYFTVLQTITDPQNQQNRMVRVARLLQKHAVSLLRRVIEKDTTLAAETDKIFSEKFLCLLSQAFKAYGVQSMADFELFFHYVQQRLFGNFFSGALESRFAYCNSLYRSFNYQTKNAQGVYYKKLLFERLNEALLGTTRNRGVMAQSKHGYYLCSSILTHYFYMHAKALPVITYGSLCLLPKSGLSSPPQLPEVFWSIYGMNPQAINYVSYLAHTIRDLYPTRYIPTKGETIATIEPYQETEMKMRTEAVLFDMGLSFQSEINISGRFIDFLIGQKLVLQLDGIHHFELTSLEMTDKTHARNLHLLYKGYQLILINIYEYNLAREHEQLKQVISAKMKLLQDMDGAMVM